MRAKVRVIGLVAAFIWIGCGEVPWPDELNSSSHPQLSPTAFAEKYGISFQGVSTSLNGAICVNLSGGEADYLSRAEAEARIQADTAPSTMEWFKKLQSADLNVARSYFQYIQNGGHSITIVGRVKNSGCVGGVPPYTGYIQSVHGAFMDLLQGKQ